MKKAVYICLEGTEGVGKTTQTQKLVDHLRAKGFKVLQTKEPGTPLAPLTMQLRAIMLDKQYDEQLTTPARELVSQAIRSVHIEKVVVPALNEYDFIVQDRGILSGLAYGTACGNDPDWLIDLAYKVTPSAVVLNNAKILYDHVLILSGNTSVGLQKALQAKQEFAAGDAMEARGNSFLQQVSDNMAMFSGLFNTKTVIVDGKGIDEVFSEILTVLNLGE